MIAEWHDKEAEKIWNWNNGNVIIEEIGDYH